MTGVRVEVARILLEGGVSQRAIAELAFEAWGYSSRESLRVVLGRMQTRGTLPRRAVRSVPAFTEVQARQLVRSCGTVAA